MFGLALGHSGVLLGSFGVGIEGSPYIYPFFKITMSQSNGLGIKNGVELHISDVSQSSRVLAVELHYCSSVETSEVNS